jgi:hypothetical protein
MNSLNPADGETWALSCDPETKVVSVSAGGVTHHFHTDPAESADFARRSNALNAGSEQLAQLIGYHPATAPAAELKRQWLANVTAAGMSHAEALDFLEGRLARVVEGDQ